MIRMFIHLKFIMSLVQQGPITFTFGFIFFSNFTTLLYMVLFSFVYNCLRVYMIFFGYRLTTLHDLRSLRFSIVITVIVLG